MHTAIAHKHDWRTSERRSCHREPLQWAVLVFFGDNWGKLIDLSERGMSFQFAHAPALHKPITFTFETMGCMPLPHDGRVFGEAVQATGQVVWTRDFERTAGVQFLELSPKSRDQIRHWMYSVPSQEAASASHQPEEELNEKWKKDWNNEADREAAAFFRAEQARTSFTEAREESLPEIAEGDLENLDSETEVVWEPEPAAEPASLEDVPSVAELREEPEPGFIPRGFEHPVSEIEEPRKTASAFARLGHGEAPAETEGLWEANPELAPHEPLVDDGQDQWPTKPAAAVEKLESLGPLGFEIPGMLEHEERQRRGQTLIVRQRRTRVGYLAVLSFLAAVGAVAGIIAFISKFSEKPELAASTLPAVTGQADSRRTQDGPVTDGAPFLVEVLDSSNRRSVLWLSSDARQNTNTTEHSGEDSSLPATLVSAKAAPAEEPAAVVARPEPAHDFSLAAPHASGASTNADDPSAPSLPGDVPVPADTPLQGSLSGPAMPVTSVQPPPPQGGEVQPARLIHATLPEYPRLARTNRVAGDVTLDALIDAAGNVRDVKVLAGPVMLREAAKQALRQWKYEPARLDGQPTAMHLTVTVKFQGNRETR